MLHSFRVLSALIFTSCLVASTFAQENAYQLLPGKAQAAVWIPDSQIMLERWNRTELSRLASDDDVAPFFREKRQEIESKLMEAGWRLSIQPEDIGDFATGQVLLAWTVEENPAKPYALVMVVDVADDEKINQKLLDKIDQQLKSQKADKATLSHEGTEIAKYVLPRRAGELVKQVSYVAIVDGELLATDDESLLKDTIDRVQGRLSEDSLDAETDFAKARELAQLSGEGQLEFFARPLGFARVIRSIAGSPSKSNTDMLVALEKQGFTALAAICGEVSFGGEELDIQYNGFVFAKKPFSLSAKVLDFPNQATNELPKFVGENIASLLVTNWNASQAFWEVEGLVDEIAGTEGVFAEVIEGIKKDPNGPQIDIREVLPLFTNDIFSVSDSKVGEAEVDSRRNMMAFKLTNPLEIARVLDNAMEREPDAKRVDFKDHTIWQVTHNANNEIDFPDSDFPEDDFADFGAPPPAAKNQDHWLSNWAITVHGEYLVFASHAEMIQEAIERSLQVESCPLVDSIEYQRVLGAIDKYHGKDPVSSWRVLFPKQAYRIQYELFRKGKLSESQSMLASILDRLLQKSEEISDEKQQIKGDGLPDFSKIENYLQPGGFTMRTADDGWSFGGMVLGKNSTAVKKKAPQPAGKTEYETARTLQNTKEARR